MIVLLVRVPKCAPDLNMNDLIFIIESLAGLILFYFFYGKKEYFDFFDKRRNILIFI